MTDQSVQKVPVPVVPEVNTGLVSTRRRKNGLLTSLRYPLISVGVAVAIMSVMEFAARQEMVSKFILPAPTRVWESLVDGLSPGGVYWPHIVSTVTGVGIGFFGAVLLGLVAGGLLTAFEPLRRTMMPFIIGFQVLPKIAIAPLIVLWLGFGQSAKIFIIVVVAFFPILVNAMQGFQIRDRNQLELFQSLGASQWQLFRYLRLPSAMPFLFAGFRLGAVFALIGSVVAEFVGTSDGLGHVLIAQKAQFNVPGVFAVLLLLMVIGLILNYIVGFAERRIAFWAREVRSDV